MNRPGRAAVVSRRFILRGVAGAGGLVLAGVFPGLPARAGKADVFEPNAFIRIQPDERVVFVIRNAEMGQGIYTGLAMLLAEELEVPLDRVQIEAAPADPARYLDPGAGEEVTGGSASMRDSWVAMRQAGAAARIMLVAAAAEGWGVKPADLRAEAGFVVEPNTGRRQSYGALAEAASRQPVPSQPPLKQASQFRLIGTSPVRMDARAKADGSAIFGADVRVPGMKFGRIMACPVLGGALADHHHMAALAVPGVRDVVALPEGIAVIGDNTWAALHGLKACNPQWKLGANATVSTEDLVAQLKAASEQTGVVAKDTGHALDVLAHATRKIEAVYELPFLAHATMEPINTTLHVRPDGAEVWVGTQVPVRARQQVAQACGLKPEQVVVHNQYIGGGFGRRLDETSVGQAARFARHLSYPVKMAWSREEDIRQDLFRPYYYDRISASLDAQGRIEAWHHRTTGSNVTARWAPEGLVNGLDPDTVEGAVETPYAIPAQRNESVACEPSAVRTLWWRGVGPTHNVFVVESMMDELAHLAGQDPLAFRLANLGPDPRARRVLEEATARANWGTPLEKGHGRGIALHHAFGTWAASVLEVRVDGDGITLVRVNTAVDCGPVVYPDAVRAQIEGGLIFGLSMAMYQEITLAQGRVVQGNFNDYRTLRIDEAPEIHVHLVPDPEAEIGGIGEVGTVAAAPALANAIFAATGRRLRNIPFAKAFGA